jgi:hypothetical protein
VKVLEKGRPQKGWAGTLKCTGSGNGGGGCGAKLLVEGTDLYITKSYDYTGDYDEFITFTCSECGCETDPPYSKVPPKHLVTGKRPRKQQRPED